MILSNLDIIMVSWYRHDILILSWYYQILISSWYFDIIMILSNLDITLMSYLIRRWYLDILILSWYYQIMNISRSLIHEPKQAHYTERVIFMCSVLVSAHGLKNENRNKHATHEYISFFNPWTETSTLLMNIFRSYYTWIYFVLYPWAETSTLHMNISRSLIHEPKQARYSWIYFVL